MPQGIGVQILSVIILISLAICQGIAARLKNSLTREFAIRGTLLMILLFLILRCLFNGVFLLGKEYGFSDAVLKWNFQLNLTASLLALEGALLVVRTARVQNSSAEITTTVKFILFVMGFNVFLNAVLNASIFFTDVYVSVSGHSYVYGPGRMYADALNLIMMVLMFTIIVLLRKSLVRLEICVYCIFVFMPFFAAILNVLGIQDIEVDGYTISMVNAVLLLFMGQYLSHNRIISDTMKQKEETEEELMEMMSDNELLAQAFSKLVLFSYRVDIQKNSYHEIKTTDWFKEMVGEDGNPIVGLARWLEQGIDADFVPKMRAFVDFGTLPERLKKKDILSIELISSVTDQWLRLYIICVRRLENGDACDTLWVVQSITEEKQREERIKEALSKVDEARRKADHDALTGLYNRAAFDRITASLSLKACRVGLVLIDVDNFKGVNDNYGHDVGDKILQLVGKTLSSNFHAKDCVFRFGGDEFAVILTNYKEGMQNFIKDRMAGINRLLCETKEEGLPDVSLSSGVAFSSEGYSENLFKLADNCLYKVKKAGKAGCIVN